MPANGYIPDEGVWTADQRFALCHETEKHGSATVGDAEAIRIESTVAALIAALEDARNDVVVLCENGGKSTDAIKEHCRSRRAILEALR